MRQTRSFPELDAHAPGFSASSMDPRRGHRGMHTAPSVATAHKATHLTTKWVGLVHDLRALGVAVRYGFDVPDETLGDIDEDGTLWVRASAPFEDQIWLMQECWRYVGLGPHASPSAQVVPRLRLVLPEQRTDEPAEPAEPAV